MNTSRDTPQLVLVPGHWLGAWAWDAVVDRLDELGVPVLPLTLPGLDPDDPDRAARTLSEQADAVAAAVAESKAATGRRVVVVGHSGANAPISVVLDRDPESIDQVIWVDSGPLADGAVFSPDLDPAVEDLPLPEFTVLADQASLDGLDQGALDRFRLRAVPEPGGVLRARVVLENGARRDVRTTLVCCSLTSTQLFELAAAGHPMFAEVAALRDVTAVDLPTGHWPMWSRPAELAETLASIVTS